MKQCYLETGLKTDETLVAGSTAPLWSMLIFFILVSVALVSYIFYEKWYGKKQFRQMPASPHYSVVPNQYSSLPTKEVSSK